MKVTVVGTGPGSPAYLLPMAAAALAEADVVVGYRGYFDSVRHLLSSHCRCIEKDLAEEEARAALALETAGQGHKVVVISSGDAGIYGMASLVHELAARSGSPIPVETLPGISAFQAAAAKLGAPIGHDFCCISLSDLLTPWSTIERRIAAAAQGDFVCCLYNPRSRKRHWQLSRFREIFLRHRDPRTPVGLARQVGRDGEDIRVTTLEALDPADVDMFTLVLVGNSQTFRHGNLLVTPRGYRSRKPVSGEGIRQESFRQILAGLEAEGRPPRRAAGTADDRAREAGEGPLAADALWALVHCIHSTGDFSLAGDFRSTEGAVGAWHESLSRGGEIVTDVTMVRAGLRKEALEKAGTRTFCYLDHPEALELAREEGLTRSQAAMRIAIARHPQALYVVGNAPTALMELCDRLEGGEFSPLGIIGVPVGFVNVVESKLRLKARGGVARVWIEGRKGGSGVAASIANAALVYGEAAEYPQLARLAV